MFRGQGLRPYQSLQFHQYGGLLEDVGRYGPAEVKEGSRLARLRTSMGGTYLIRAMESEPVFGLRPFLCPGHGFSTLQALIGAVLEESLVLFARGQAAACEHRCR